MKAAVKVKNLTKSFGKEKVLKGISHTFEAGKIHGIMGFNGSGKTVMFKCICGFLQPDRGSPCCSMVLSKSANGRYLGRSTEDVP